MTAVAVVPAPGVNGYPSRFDASAIARTVSISTVRFAHPDARADRTVRGGAASPWAKPGPTAYKAERPNLSPILRGSYSGIMGLPLFETAALLRTAGVAILRRD